VRSEKALDEAMIRASLGADARAVLGDLLVLVRVDSTNTELVRRPAPPGQAQVCLAEHQTAGRGRRGRSWKSPPGSNLYLSVSWPFDGGVEAMAGLSLAVGVALCDALETLGVDGLALKWPNDVLRGAGKLAGTLIELRGDATGPCRGIVGTGVNVRMPAHVGHGIDQPWADLADLDLCRSELAAALLDRLLPLLADFATTGFAPWRERWQARHVHADRAVRIVGTGPDLAGTAVGVDERGALLLRTATGVQAIHAGEVSLRAAF
jgi:BirA family transcriptional regulator, biotin operon repressor / biotin---[acetyl-CoA-carboxylase] ligase